jgi:D-alanine-D-alanine ligase
VKPVGEESSDGIAKASLVKSEADALDRVRFVHERFETDALIEEYIDGRELYLGVLGNKRLTVLPPREIFFGEPTPVAEPGAEPAPEEADAPRFATAKAKWDDAYRKKWKIRNGPAGPLPQGLERKLGELARRVYQILHIRGVGRIDVRLSAAGEVVVIEANPNPSLAKEDDFAQAAAQTGMDYDALIQRILENAVR